MKTVCNWVLLLACVFVWLAVATEGANRVRAGRWEMTLTVAGRGVSRSTCLSQADADAINGDERSIKEYADRVGAPAGCKVTDVKIMGNQVIVSSVCAEGKQNVGTTTYHDDSFETVNTNGAKSQSKWVGPCKP